MNSETEYWKERCEAAEDLIEKEDDQYTLLEYAKAQQKWYNLAQTTPPKDEWIKTDDRLPEGECIAYYVNAHGKGRTIRAHYLKKHQEEADSEADTEWLDYDEATDNYYYPAGWYEDIDNWGDYAFVRVHEGEPTHWQALPPSPNL